MASASDSSPYKPTRYPDWPASPSDLVPLPLCDGPKLRTFDFQGPQNIEFLDIIGVGSHSFVLKVRISGMLYALKAFRFLYFDDWAYDVCASDLKDNDRVAVFCQSQEPFNAECRAYGRLEESGHTELSVKCYGYVLLDEKHERALIKKLSAGKASEEDLCGRLGNRKPDKEDLRKSVAGTRTGRPPPIRCLVKELGQPLLDDTGRWTGVDPPYPTHRSVAPILRSVKQLHQLGIINLDIKTDQFINGKIADFSTAMTAPHFLMTPGMNQHLTPECVSEMEECVFGICVTDYLEYDVEVVDVLRDHNLDHDREHIKLPYAFPGGMGFRPQHDLRDRPGPRFWTFVNPTRLLERRRRRSGAPSRGRPPSRRAWPLERQPPRWYFECGQDHARLILAGVGGGGRDMVWTYRDGHMWPASSGPKFQRHIADWTTVG